MHSIIMFKRFLKKQGLIFVIIFCDLSNVTSYVKEKLAKFDCSFPTVFKKGFRLIDLNVKI